MSLDTTKILEVLDPQSGKVVEKKTFEPMTPLTEAMIPYPRDVYGDMTLDYRKIAPKLMEAGNGEISTYNFPDALRQGIMFDIFTNYKEVPTTYQNWCRVTSSTRQQEEWLRDASVGIAPIVTEGAPYPLATTSFDSGTIIKNYKRGYRLEVTREMQMFDQIGKVRELAELLGRAMRRTEEQAAMNVLTTTANYTRTNTAGDNDESATGSGANTQTLTFTPANLIAAFNILRTMKDRATGNYLGVQPNTLVVAPKLEWFVMSFINSPDLWRVGGPTTAEVYGAGTNNTFFGIVKNVIVSPEFGSGFQWALMEAPRAVTFQQVAPLNVLQEGPGSQTANWMQRDVIQYRVDEFFGVGMRDDRFAFFSDSTTAPTAS